MRASLWSFPAWLQTFPACSRLKETNNPACGFKERKTGREVEAESEGSGDWQGRGRLQRTATYEQDINQAPQTPLPCTKQSQAPNKWFIVYEAKLLWNQFAGKYQANEKESTVCPPGKLSILGIVKSPAIRSVNPLLGQFQGWRLCSHQGWWC